MSYVYSKKRISGEKKATGSFNIFVIVGVVIGLLLVGTLVASAINGDFFDPISIVSNATMPDLRETDGRTNILLIGSDKRDSGVVTSVLTDTLLFVSIGRVDKDVVMISLPRDLWVHAPSGYQSKINEVYIRSGVEDLVGVTENVLGVPIHYYGVVGFDMFTEAIDILGGITVNVQNSFTDTFYPVEGKENAPRSERYETVHFEKGLQLMDGATALKFARSRKGDNGEGTDFARAARQQLVIAAIKDKALSLETLISPAKIKEFYDLYKGNVETNLTFSDIQSFLILSQQINFDKVISVVLDDRSAADSGGLLISPENAELYNGAYVLIPQAGDYSQIHAYVQRYLFGEDK